MSTWLLTGCAKDRCREGYTGSPSYCNCSENFRRRFPMGPCTRRVVCDPPNAYNPNTDSCCSDGSLYNTITRRCEPICAPADAYNPNTRLCCSGGQAYDPTSRQCEPRCTPADSYNPNTGLWAVLEDKHSIQLHNNVKIGVLQLIPTTQTLDFAVLEPLSTIQFQDNVTIGVLQLMPTTQTMDFAVSEAISTISLHDNVNQGTENQRYDPTSQKCEPRCTRDQIYNPTSLQCEGKDIFLPEESH